MQLTTGLKAYLVFGLMLCLLACLVGIGQADEYAAKEQELAKVKEAQREAKDLLAELSKAETEVMAELRQLEQDLGKAKQELVTVEQGLQRTKSSIAEVKDDVQAATGRYEQSKKQLNEVMVGYNQRLREIYMAGGTDLFDLLLMTEDTGDWVMRLKLFTALLEQDIALYEKVSAQKVTTDKEKERLESKLQRLQKEQSNLASLEKQASRRIEQVSKAKTQRDQKLAQILSEKTAQQQAVQEFETNSKKIQAWLEAHKTPPIPTDSAGRAKFLRPVTAPVTAKYGWRVHPIDKVNRFHEGVDFGAPEGAPIKAAGGGQVVLAGWVGGYGYTVIIEHADGYSTVYAHASRLLVEVGDPVAAGHVVAEVGSTGLSTGPHLHFEVRQSGRPVNPLDYLGE